MKGNKDKDKKAAAVMVAPRPMGKSPLQPVEELADAAGLMPWQLAGLRRACGWAPGKQVSQADFEQAVARFEQRAQGGGKL